MHGLEGNKVFAAILFGIFAALGVTFVPRVLTEFTDAHSHVREWMAGEVHHDKPACDPDTGRHAIIPGMCLIPESPRPQMPMMPFALELVAADLDLASNLTQKPVAVVTFLVRATQQRKPVQTCTASLVPSMAAASCSLVTLVRCPATNGHGTTMA